MAAVNHLISTGQAGDITNVAQLKGLERTEAIQRTREYAAAKLETLRNRGTKVMLPLPSTDFFSEPLLRQVYGNRKAGETTYFTTEDSQTLNHSQGVVAMNQLLATDPSGSLYRRAHQFLVEHQFKPINRVGQAGPETFEILRTLVGELTGGASISLPFVGKSIDFSAQSGNVLELAKALDSIRTLKVSSAGARQSAKAYEEEVSRLLENPRGEGPPPAVDTRIGTGATAVAELLPSRNYPAGFMKILKEIKPSSVASSVAPPSSRSSVAPSNAAAVPPARTQRPSAAGWQKLSSAAKDGLLKEYGVPKSGSRTAQYQALMAV
jgi:hypothetical protein